jgi:hypothetical protein
MRYEIRNTRYESGFTLIEVLVAILFVGMAIASLVGANIAFTKANGAGTDMTTAEFLSEQIRELTATLPVCDPSITNISNWITLGPESGETLALYDDVDDFDGASFSPPIDANRQQLTDFAAYRQDVTVQKVNPSNFQTIVADNYSSSFVKVTVTVSLNSTPISTISWLRAKY